MNPKQSYAQIGKLLDEEGLQFFIEKANEEIAANRAKYESKLAEFKDLEAMYFNEKGEMDKIVAEIQKKKAWLENIEKVQALKKEREANTPNPKKDSAFTQAGAITSKSTRTDWLGLCINIIKGSKKFMQPDEVYKQLVDTNDEINNKIKSLPIYQQNAQANIVITRLIGAAENTSDKVMNPNVRQLVMWQGLIGINEWMEGGNPKPTFYAGAVIPDKTKKAAGAPVVRKRPLRVGRKENVLK